MISRAQPVAFKLMTALASATISADGSVKQVGDPIGLAPFLLLTVQNLRAARHRSRYRRRASCPSLSSPRRCASAASRFSRSVVGRSASAFCAVGGRKIAQNLPRLLVRNAAVCLKPVPGSGLIRPSSSRRRTIASRDTPKKCAKTMTCRRVSRSDPAVTSWNFLRHAARRRQECPPESIGITLLARVFGFMTMENFRVRAASK